MKTRFSLGVLLASAAFSGSATAATFAPYTSPAQSMLIGGAGFVASPLVSIGETLPNSYQPVGIMDGIGAWKQDARTVRVMVNHELGATAGKSYTIEDGAGGTVTLKGARISFFDIDTATRGIVDAGQAYDRIFDRAGSIVSTASQIGGGISRLCSAAAFEPNSFGAGAGLADRIYFGGEETANGSMFALDTATKSLHAVPAMGRGAWENVAQINTGNANTVAFIVSDDSSGTASDPGSPLYLYVGQKNALGDNSFLDRNGLAEGKLYVWKANGGDASPVDFNGNGSTRNGQWIEIQNRDISKAGTPGYDALGYADQQTLRTQATAVGAFRFSRPEDVATNPQDSTLIALASTGSSQFGGADSWGVVYTVDTQFDTSGHPVSASTKIVYDGNDDPANALRNPDNLSWSGAGELLIQEDRATAWEAGSNLAEAGILSLLLDGTISTAARIDRSATLGFTDANAGKLGEWESSGILDVSALFGQKDGTLFLTDVQAHGLQVGSALVEGGQLLFISPGMGAVPEPASWAMMIAGFGMVGGALRRRGPKVALA